MDAKRSIAKIDGITKLLKHKKDPKDQAQLMKQLATHTRRLDHTVADIAEADESPTARWSSPIKRTDMEALIAASSRSPAPTGTTTSVSSPTASSCGSMPSEPSRSCPGLAAHVPPSARRTARRSSSGCKQATAARSMSVEDPGRGLRGGDLPDRAALRGDPGRLGQGGGDRGRRRRVPRVPARRGDPRDGRVARRCRSRSTSSRPRSEGDSRAEEQPGRPRPRTRSSRRSSVASRSCRATTKRVGRPKAGLRRGEATSASPCPPPPQIAARREVPLAPTHLERRRQDDPRAARADRVAERDRSAVRVHDRLVDARACAWRARPRPRTPR